jgi:prolyl-tRNA editing enzyme YbaK/EbsC (Cys-tRNA(Pro) deacylase)
MSPLTPADLRRFMETHAIPGEIIHLDMPTPTVETAAQAVGAQTAQIIKSVLFLLGAEQPLLAVASGTARIDYRLIADHCGTSRRRVKLADAAAVLRITGYPAGAVPPFGHPAPLRTLIDPLVLQQPLIYAGGGDDHALLRLHPADIRRVTSAEVISLQSQ